MIMKGIGLAVIILIVYVGGFLVGYGCGRCCKKSGSDIKETEE